MVMKCPGYSEEFDPTQVFRTILVPVDFSPASRRALITACETRERFGSEIHVFICTEDAPSSPLRGLAVQFGHEDAVEEARRCLEYFGESICNGMPCLTNNATFGSDVVSGVIRAAADCDASMVIMGLHQKHSLFRTRAEKIVQGLAIPVLLLQGDSADHVIPAEHVEVPAEHVEVPAET